MGISIWPSMEQGSQVEVNGVRSMKGDPQVEVNRGGGFSNVGQWRGVLNWNSME